MVSEVGSDGQTQPPLLTRDSFFEQLISLCAVVFLLFLGVVMLPTLYSFHISPHTGFLRFVYVNDISFRTEKKGEQSCGTLGSLGCSA